MDFTMFIGQIATVKINDDINSWFVENCLYPELSNNHVRIHECMDVGDIHLNGSNITCGTVICTTSGYMYELPAKCVYIHDDTLRNDPKWVYLNYGFTCGDLVDLKSEIAESEVLQYLKEHSKPSIFGFDRLVHSLVPYAYQMLCVDSCNFDNNCATLDYYWHAYSTHEKIILPLSWLQKAQEIPF